MFFGLPTPIRRNVSMGKAGGKAGDKSISKAGGKDVSQDRFV